MARITIFLVCLLLGWLLGLRDNPLLLLLLATTVSMLISLLVLRSMREQFATQVADKVEHRFATKQVKAARRRSDEVIEDDELGQPQMPNEAPQDRPQH
ncbi:MAG: DUF4229 domain-containing protein [Micrococcales bacterium]|nr:DUF4229 domain-containing protein [Micrococcales bacterium]